MTIFAGERVVQLEAGRCAVAPKGLPHVYRVDPERARWLAITSPARFKRFVAERRFPPKSFGSPRASRRSIRSA